MFLLDNDIDTARWDLQDMFSDFPDFLEAQHVLINLRHPIRDGRRGLSGFKRNDKSYSQMDWKEAAKELEGLKTLEIDSP